MIKIITEDTEPTPKKMTRRFTCRHCGCTFTADKDDYDTYFLPLSGYEYFCKCPCCGYGTSKSVPEEETK